MLYWLFYEKLFHLYSPFRVFQYSTFRIAMASLTALLLSMLLGPWLIARLSYHQVGQVVRDDGPQTHLIKAGTPTKVVSERLGHAKTSITEDLYQHVIPGMQREAAASFAAAVKAERAANV